MKLDQLERLAKAAIDNHLPMLQTLNTPHAIIAMIDVIRVADAMRGHFPHGQFDRWQDRSVCEDYDAHRAKLEEL